jgi:probable rRNA maturation factor
MPGFERRPGNKMVKNVSVNFSLPADFRRNMVHKSVSFLKKELNFKLSSLIINFVSSEEIIQINSEFLGHNYITDIITFDYSETNYDIDGEIYISLEESGRNSVLYKSTTNEEVIRLITHGVLHLLGYSDKGQKEKKEMKIIEDHLVDKQRFIWV